MKSILPVFLMLFFVIACKESYDENLSPATESAIGNLYSINEESKVETNFESQTEQKIIKESNLRYETQDLEATYQQIIASVKKNKAYVQSDTEGKDYNSLYRTITVRIPNANFDAFLTDVGKGVAYFDRKEISAKDVTAEFIDIKARLKAKKTLEERYLQLLTKASKVSEILEIEKELSAIREEIEAKEGQLKYLQNRVSLSTVTIEFYKKVADADNATVSYGAKMWNAIKSGWNGISSFFIGLLHIWPFILILVAVIFIIRKKLKKKNS